MCTSWVSLMTHLWQDKLICLPAAKPPAFKSLFSLVLDCISIGLTSIGVCVHTNVHGTCHVLSVHPSSICSFNTQLVYITIDVKNTFST